MDRRTFLTVAGGVSLAPLRSRAGDQIVTTSDIVDTRLDISKSLRELLGGLSEDAIIALTKSKSTRLFYLIHDNWEKLDEETRRYVGYILYRSLELRGLISGNLVQVETIASTRAFFDPDTGDKSFHIQFARMILINGVRDDSLTIKHSSPYSFSRKDLDSFDKLNIEYDTEHRLLILPTSGVISLVGDGNVPKGWTPGMKTNTIPTDEIMQFNVLQTLDGTIVLMMRFDGGGRATQIYIRNNTTMDTL